MATIAVSILGLGRIGTSVGLALKRYNEGQNAKHTFVTTAYDDSSSIQQTAGRLGFADKLVRNKRDAVEGRDIVILAMPYAEVRATYEAIGPALRPGAVVLDMSPLKGPSLEWAKSYLTEAHLVGITPIVNPKYLFDGLDDIQHASADLFDNGSMLLMPSPTCVKEAVELAADFATLLGAKPHFLDPAEHDGLVAATEGLPALLGVVTFHMAQKAHGWHDLQRLTNPSFGRLTHHLYDTHPDDLRDAWLHNRDNLVRQIDSLMAALGAFRKILADGDQDALEAALVEAAEAYEGWLNRRYKGRWEEKESSTPASGSMMDTMLGDYLSKRLRGDRNDRS